MRNPDSIEIPAGVTHWPETLRKVARAANAAGRAGYQVADVEAGIDLDALKQKTKREGFEELRRDWPTRIEITYF